jgi:hypothetical protein
VKDRKREIVARLFFLPYFAEPVQGKYGMGGKIPIFDLTSPDRFHIVLFRYIEKIF